MITKTEEKSMFHEDPRGVGGPGTGAATHRCPQCGSPTWTRATVMQKDTGDIVRYRQCWNTNCKYRYSTRESHYEPPTRTRPRKSVQPERTEGEAA